MAIARTLESWRRWVEPWYVPYALIGVAVAGVAPIFLPLWVDRAGSTTDVGLVMAIFGLGQLSAAAWGDLADRLRWHRVLFAGGALVAALAFAGLPFTQSVPTLVAVALVLGVGMAAANTVASLFVVEVYPQEEWDARIGWLQTFYNGGAVAGMLLAGALTSLPLQVGLLTAGALTVVAVLLGWATTRTPARPPAARTPGPQAIHHPQWSHYSPLRLMHYLNRRSLQQLEVVLRSPFALFLVLWLLCNLGPAALYALYPLFMQQVFGIPPGPSSFALGVSGAVAIALYAPTGLFVHRVGPTRVLQAGLGVRLGALVLLTGLGLVPIFGRDWLAILTFIGLDLAWVLLSVSGTVLVSRLSPVAEGEGMGIYNTVAAMASLLGAALGGWLADRAGYGVVLGMAVAGLAGALGLMLLLRAAPHAAQLPPADEQPGGA